MYYILIFILIVCSCLIIIFILNFNICNLFKYFVRVRLLEVFFFLFIVMLKLFNEFFKL